MPDAQDKLTLIQRIRERHLVVMAALQQRQRALFSRIVDRLDRTRAEKIAKDIKGSP